MDEIKKIERPELEHYYELLLKQFKDLRQGSLKVKLEEERIELALRGRLRKRKIKHVKG